MKSDISSETNIFGCQLQIEAGSGEGPGPPGNNNAERAPAPPALAAPPAPHDDNHNAAPPERALPPLSPSAARPLSPSEVKHSQLEDNAHAPASADGASGSKRKGLYLANTNYQDLARIVPGTNCYFPAPRSVSTADWLRAPRVYEVFVIRSSQV
ncbi:hypothetical protein EVAR_78561_1 [Eumeta japonica]|uniref:Uncharacterized protein n=1 Tax=Eumeta variegata TaxID=151549 RepID=A0A4C1W8M3_EUMVA|nr:hypothetical protein EVAR_78561_1 [Eumeta japonica]